MPPRTGYFSPFAYRSRGGALRRQQQEQQTKRSLDAAQPFFRQTAQQMQQAYGGLSAAIDRAQQAQPARRIPDFAGRGRTPWQRGVANATARTERGNRIARSVARGFAPEETTGERMRRLLRPQSAQVDANRARRMGIGAERARLFRRDIDSLQEAAELTGFAQQAEKSRGYLRDKYPDLLPSEALKRELESGSFEAEASLRPGVEFETAQARQRIDPNNLGDRVFNRMFQSVVPEPAWEQVERVPYAGEPIANTGRFIASPVGAAATVATGGQAALAGIGGSIALGTAGNVAEEFGAPGYTSTAGEIVGGLTPAGIVKRGGRPFIRQAAREIVPEVEEAAPRAIDDLLPSERLAQQLDAERVIPEAGTLPAGARTPLAGVQSEPMDRTVRVGGIEMSVQSHPDFPEVMIDIERTSGRASLSELRQLEQEVGKIVAEHPGRPVRAIVVNPELAEVLSRRGAIEVFPGGADVASVYDVRPLGRNMGVESSTSTSSPGPRPGATEASPPPATIYGPRGEPLSEVNGVRVDIDDDVFGGRSVGAARAADPTMRETEAISARPTISDRRESAEIKLARLAPDARPQTPDEVAQAQGNRYQSSLFDSLFNWQRRRAGKDTKLISDTRRVNVTRDIYTHQEGGATRARVQDWLGRHKGTLGMDFEKGTMSRVQMRPGATIPGEVAQTPKDIARHPEDYIFTPEQQQAWDEGQELFRTAVLNEQRGNIDIMPIDGYYWPEAVIKAPGKYDGPMYRPLTHQNMSVSPWFTKSRTGLDPRKAKGQGVQYANDFDAMMARLEGSHEAIGNRWAIDQLKALGHKPTIGDDLVENLKNAQTRFKEARAASLKADTEAKKFLPKPSGQPVSQLAFDAGTVPPRDLASAAKQEFIEAQDALNAAKAAARQAGLRIKEEGPRLFGVVMPRDAVEEFSRYIAKTDPAWYDEMFRVQRTILVNGDYGSPMLQNYMLFWNNPKAWLKAAAMGAMAIRKAPLEYVAQNRDTITKLVRLGFVSPPEEMLLREGGSASQRLGKLPILKQTQRMFEWNVFIGQVERGKAYLRSGMTDKQLREIADVTRKQSGVMFEPGITAAKAKWMSRFFFAPQYMQALNGMLLDPLTKSGPARREAIKSLGMMLGGAASTAVGLNYALNGELPNMDEPSKPGFWGVKLPDGGYVYPFGPMQPTIKMMAELAIDRDPKAIPRFLEGKASLPARWVLAGIEAMGAPLESVRGPAFGRPDEKLSFAKLGEDIQNRDALGAFNQAVDQGILPAPIGIGQSAKAAERGSPFGALESFGIRTTPPPSEASKAFQARRELEGLPKYKGVSIDEQEQIAKLIRETEEARAAWRDIPENQGREMESFSDSVRQLARIQGVPDALVSKALRLNTAEGKAANISSAWDKFVLDNWDLLEDSLSATDHRRLRAIRERRVRP